MPLDPDHVTISVRMTRELDRQVRELARRERRALSPQVVYIVERYLEESADDILNVKPPRSTPETDAAIEWLEAQLADGDPHRASVYLFVPIDQGNPYRAVV